MNAHPLKSEMSVGTPKAQAKEPIQFDIAIVCRKTLVYTEKPPSQKTALNAAKEKLARLESGGFTLSRNDQKIVLFGQLLTTLRESSELGEIAAAVESTQEELPPAGTATPEIPTVDFSPRAKVHEEAQVQLSVFSR